MKKMMTILLIIVLTVSVTGCKGKTKNNIMDIVEKTPQQDIKRNEDASEFTREILIEDERIKTPTDIACDDDCMYVVCNEGNEILKIDYDGNIVDGYGKIGQGEGEFTNPYKIAISDQYIYVIEDSARRIQVFDKAFQYIKSVDLSELKLEYYGDKPIAFDLAVDSKENLYITVYANYLQEKQKVYIIDPEGNISSFGERLLGYMCPFKEDMLYVHAMNPYQKHAGTTKLGNYFLGKIHNGEMKLFSNLVKDYGANTICVDDKNIYIYSGLYNQLDQYDENGNYIKTLYSEYIDMKAVNGVYNFEDWRLLDAHMDKRENAFYFVNSDVMGKHNDAVYVLK